jgi:DNA-binding transcriptional ArsR family regulator
MTVHLTEERVLTQPGELKAIAHPIRTRILGVLEKEPASAKRLAERLEMSHGRIGHHLKVLEAAGLVAVVEERRVRAMTERIYAPTFVRLRVQLDDGAGELRFFFEQAAREAAGHEQPFAGLRRLYVVRLPRSRAAEFAERLRALAEEFAAAGEDEGEVFGLAQAVFLARDQ